MGARSKNMTKTTDIEVGGYFAEFIERQVKQGRYGSATDVVQAGLRLLEHQESQLEALRMALVEGEQSGLSTPFDFDAFIDRKRKEREKIR
jgi:antitoxin ParD1/3/4